MRLSRLTDYAVVIMAHLAGDTKTAQSAVDIAGQVRIPLPTVSKILKSLTRRGLLTSQRGARGGYVLARAPGRISLVEIIDALEGPLALTECSCEEQGCAIEPDCAVRDHWRDINRRVRESLNGITLAQMRRGRREKSAGSGVRQFDR